MSSLACCNLPLPLQSYPMVLAAAACCRNTGSWVVIWRTEESEEMRDHQPGSLSCFQRAVPQRSPTTEDPGLQLGCLLDRWYEQGHKALEQRQAHVVVDQVLYQLDGWRRREMPGRPCVLPNPAHLSPRCLTPLLAPSAAQHWGRPYGEVTLPFCPSAARD